MTEIDRHQVHRAVLIASVPGDELSVVEALVAYPAAFVGFFMVNPLAEMPSNGRDGAGRRPARRMPVSGDAPLLPAGPAGGSGRRRGG